MTNVKFFKKNNNFVGFVSEGHACYAKHGKDIVCAAVSTAIQSAAIGVVNVVGISATLDRNDSIGFFRLELPSDITDVDMKNSQIILKTLFLTIENLAQGYPKNIKLEEFSYDN